MKTKVIYWIVAVIYQLVFWLLFKKIVKKNNDVKTIIVELQAMTIFSINYCVVYCLRKNVLCMFRDPKVKSANCFFSLSKTQRYSICSDIKQRRLLDYQNDWQFPVDQLMISTFTCYFCKVKVDKISHQIQVE